VSDLIQKIALAIDPLTFRSREKFIAYCLKDGDDQETAERYAQMTYGGNIEQALHNATQALAAIKSAGYAVVPIAKMDELVIAAGNCWGAGSEQHNLVRDMADLIAKHRPIVPALIADGAVQ